MSRSTRATESNVPVIGVEDGWDDNSTKKLLEKMRSLLPKPDAVKYKTTLEKFKWETMKIDSFGPEQCKKQWGRLYKKLRKYRTLNDLIGESLEFLDDPYKGVAKKHPDHPKRPLTPYFRFFLEQRRIYAETHKDLSNIEITTILSQKYRDISPDVKQKYIEDWKKEMVEYRKKIENFKKNHPEYYDKPPPNPPRTPVQIYKDLCTNKKKIKSETSSSKSPYHDLPDSEKLPYILQAVEEFATYQKEISAYKKSHPAYCANEKKSVLSKEDWKIHDKSLGKPDRPPANGYNLFCSRLMVSDELKHYSSRERIMQCGKLWQELADDEKKKYNEEYLKIRNEYRENLKKFLKNLSPAVREAYLARKHSENNAGKSIKKEDLFSTSLKAVKKEESDMSDSSDDEEIEMNDTSEESQSSETSEAEQEEPPVKKIKSPPKVATPAVKQTKTRKRTIDKIKSETREWKQSNAKSSRETSKTSSSTHPTKPLSAVFIYQQKNRKKFEKLFPYYPSSEITKIMTRTFCNLPVRQKLKYKMTEYRLQHKRQAEMLNKLESGNTAMSELKAVTGEQIYHEQNRNLYLQKHECTEDNVDVLMRRAWSRMNKDRREKYIQIAHRINQQNIAERSAALASGSKAVSFNGQITDMSPKSIEAYHLYEPTKPPEEGFALFIRENKHKVQHIVPPQRANQLSNLWNEKSEKIRNYYEETASLLLEDYKKKHSKWLKSLPKTLQEKYKKDGFLLTKEEMKKRKKSRIKKPSTDRNLYSDWDFSSDEEQLADSSTSESDVSSSEVESGFNESASDHTSAEESSNSSSTDSQTETDDEED